ncbi:MAG: hypothetical protein ACYCDV_00060 [Facklamia hominis]
MKSLSKTTQPDDLVTVKYLNDNITKIIGGGISVPIILKNLVKNGDFSNGSENWKLPNGVISNGKLKIKNLGEPSNQRITASKGNKIYLYARAEAVKNNANFSYEFNIKLATQTDIHNNYRAVDNKNGSLSQIFESPIDDPLVVFNGWQGYGFEVEYYFDDIVAIDLTASFGKDQEPTKAQMDRLIERIGYFETTQINILI